MTPVLTDNKLPTTRRPRAGALANIDPQPILRRIESGESLPTIARDLGVSHVGLRAWLLREDRDQYHEMITAALTIRVAEADEMLAAAQDAITVARARETARFARMDLERRRPHLYGQRQQLDITHRKSYSDVLRSLDVVVDADVIEHEPGADQDNAA